MKQYTGERRGNFRIYGPHKLARPCLAWEGEGVRKILLAFSDYDIPTWYAVPVYPGEEPDFICGPDWLSFDAPDTPRGNTDVVRAVGAEGDVYRLEFFRGCCH